MGNCCKETISIDNCVICKDLSCKKLESLPTEIGNLINLQILHLTRNQFKRC